MYYSRIQVLAIVTSAIGTVVMLWLAKQFHDMDAGYLPYLALLGSFVCVSLAKGILLDGTWIEDEEEEEDRTTVNA